MSAINSWCVAYIKRYSSVFYLCATIWSAPPPPVYEFYLCALIRSAHSSSQPHIVVIILWPHPRIYTVNHQLPKAQRWLSWGLLCRSCKHGWNDIVSASYSHDSWLKISGGTGGDRETRKWQIWFIALFTELQFKMLGIVREEMRYLAEKRCVASVDFVMGECYSYLDLWDNWHLLWPSEERSSGWLCACLRKRCAVYAFHFGSLSGSLRLYLSRPFLPFPLYAFFRPMPQSVEVVTNMQVTCKHRIIMILTILLTIALPARMI